MQTSAIAGYVTGGHTDPVRCCSTGGHTMQSTTRPIALVLGANGRLGAAAVEAFAAAGWAVLAQATSSAPAAAAGWTS